VDVWFDKGVRGDDGFARQGQVYGRHCGK
jgi:hypothetical protein